MREVNFIDDRDCHGIKIRDRDDCHHHEEKCKPEVIILECGHRPQDAYFEIEEGTVTPDQEFVLDRVRIDMACLTKPMVKIEFSSLVVFEAEDTEAEEFEVEVDLLFSLVRVSKGEREVVQTWRYLYNIATGGITELTVEMSQPFTVTYCDKPCPGTCEYLMIVEGNNFVGDFATMRVIRPDLSVIAKSIC
ncbi:MAG TPA: DUF4489 domain-containing protein [Candidatus Atribacteria bacterium]|nr:DUF4489 domain-containing protein [Candidatus Atribacteria bacterium]HPT78642.1 DUF4489 domain-containing protein [Candidatus Atribacteria bacterium]